MQLEVGLLQNFCEVIGCPRTGEAALVDPAFEVDRLLAEARRRGWRVTTIFLTHTHDDHVAGLDEAAALTGAVVRCHPLEVATARRLAPRVEAVADGEEVPLGDGRVRAIFAPDTRPAACAGSSASRPRSSPATCCSSARAAAPATSRRWSTRCSASSARCPRRPACSRGTTTARRRRARWATDRDQPGPARRDAGGVPTVGAAAGR
ncbi:MBL fold metallo-hydrolase [Nannocystis pusilla]|uniref:MBL fold metallo-hydrolase n=1 Tax=Nannocystis pusilla TaxID=889268 RepID=UPI003B7A282A